MQLIDNWRKLWLKLWSVKLSLAASLASALEAGFQWWALGKPSMIVIAAILISLGAGVARIVSQPSLRE